MGVISMLHEIYLNSKNSDADHMLGEEHRKEYQKGGAKFTGRPQLLSRDPRKEGALGDLLYKNPYADEDSDLGIAKIREDPSDTADGVAARVFATPTEGGLSESQFVHLYIHAVAAFFAALASGHSIGECLYLLHMTDFGGRVTLDEGDQGNFGVMNSEAWVRCSLVSDSRR